LLSPSASQRVRSIACKPAVAAAGRASAFPAFILGSVTVLLLFGKYDHHALQGAICQQAVDSRHNVLVVLHIIGMGAVCEYVVQVTVSIVVPLLDSSSQKASSASGL
jgi:hypothetical protein